MSFGASVALVPGVVAFLFVIGVLAAPSARCGGCLALSGDSEWEPASYAATAIGDEPFGAPGASSNDGPASRVPSSRAPASRSARGDGAGPTSAPPEPTRPCAGYDSIEAMIAASP